MTPPPCCVQAVTPTFTLCRAGDQASSVRWNPGGCGCPTIQGMDGLAPQRTPHGTRPVRLHRLWAMLMCWAALLLGPAPAVAAIPARSQGLQLQVAEFRTDAQSPWQRVELPDTWSYRGLANGGAGQYRLEVDLGSSAPIEVWALRAERMSTHHEVRINGVWVRGHLGSDEGPPRPMPSTLPVSSPRMAVVLDWPPSTPKNSSLTSATPRSGIA